MNLAGAFLGTAVAKTISTGMFVDGTNVLPQMVFAGLTGAVTWNYKQNWRFKGFLSTYTKTLVNGVVTGVATGVGTLYWWNPALNDWLGGWDVAGYDVNVSIMFQATTTTSKTTTPGAFTISFPGFTPAGGLTLPTYSMTGLKGGGIKLSPNGWHHLSYTVRDKTSDDPTGSEKVRSLKEQYKLDDPRLMEHKLELGDLEEGKASGPAMADARRLLKEAEQAIKRARDLTARLLTFSRGGAAVREAFSLGDLVREGDLRNCEFINVESEFAAMSVAN